MASERGRKQAYRKGTSPTPGAIASNKGMVARAIPTLAKRSLANEKTSPKREERMKIVAGGRKKSENLGGPAEEGSGGGVVWLQGSRDISMKRGPRQTGHKERL